MCAVRSEIRVPVRVYGGRLRGDRRPVACHDAALILVANRVGETLRQDSGILDDANPHVRLPYLQGECHLSPQGGRIMDTIATTPAPSGSTTFVPLPSGDSSPVVTPERVREQLGWGLLQANWR